METKPQLIDLEKQMVFSTPLGTSYLGKAEEILLSDEFISLHGKVDLIFTSPPFPLNRKKKYGNFQGEAYINWLSDFAPIFRNILKPTGSIVIEVGNSWEPGIPAMSTLALESLLTFLKTGGFFLCQQFIYNNPAKLPSPAQWVNIERIRVKDSFTTIWWMSLTAKPKADNRKILKEYSSAMNSLLRQQKYNSGKRPSEHNIGEKSFLKNNGGAIPSNVISLSNNHANTEYLNYCRKNNLLPHPARMPSGLPEFFIKFLTEKGDLVVDPFAGSNTTGACAEKLDRNWASIEPNIDYIQGSLGRFEGKATRIGELY